MMDKLDYLLLSELLKDAQMPFATIAKKIGISPQTAISRYKKMKKEGIIFSCVASVDLSKLGYQGKAMLMITNSPSQNKSVTLTALTKIKNIIVISEIMGAFDILAVALVTDLNSIRELVAAVKRLDSVQGVQIAFVDDTDLPLTPNFGTVFSKKSYELATT